MSRKKSAVLSVIFTFVLFIILWAFIDLSFYGSEKLKNMLLLVSMSFIAVIINALAVERLSKARKSLKNIEIMQSVYGTDTRSWPESSLHLEKICAMAILNVVGVGLGIYALLIVQDRKYICTGD